MDIFKTNTGPLKPVVPYNDRYFRIVLSILASHILVMYNEADTFFEAIFTLSYWVGMAGSSLISIALTAYINALTVRLDRRFDWQEQPLQRLFWQSLLGFISPALLAFALAAFFFAALGIHILSTSYLREDYTIIVLMLLALNLYYFGLNSYLLRGKTTQAVTDKQQEETQTREVLIVDTPVRSIPVQLKEVSYFFILGRSVYMRTEGMASLGESYQLDIPLKQLEGTLDKNMFFRINRQMIVNFKACDFYRPGKNKTLELALTPMPYPEKAKVPKEHERLLVISEDRVPDFKTWMDR